MIVVSRIKKYVKDNHELRVAEAAMTALEKQVEALIDKAAAKAKADKKKTIQGPHLFEG